jgi:hypothetical protein
MRRLHRWHRRTRWWEADTPAKRWRHVRSLVKTPLRAAREVIFATRRYGRALREEHGIPLAAQAAVQWMLRMRFGLPPDSYYLLELHRPERRRLAGEWCSLQACIALFVHLDRLTARDDLAAVCDKRRFAERCLAHGLPVVPMLAEAAGGEVTGHAWSGTGPLPQCDLFTKPADLWSGQGALAWTHVGVDLWRGSDGRELDQEGLLGWLREASKDRPHVLQERIANHPALASLSRGGLCTVRFVTMRLPEGGIGPLLGVLKMPSGDQVVDNFAQGGLAAGIDEVTGRLGSAVQEDARYAVRRYAEHPGTGARIEGRVVPFWKELQALVLRAHEAFPYLVFCGFDVALREDGPVLIEGNDLPGLDLIQMPHGRPIGTTRFAEVYDFHMRRALAAGPARRVTPEPPTDQR